MSVDFAIPGEPAAIRASAATTRAKGQSFTQVGDALGRIGTDGWTGRAADHFHDAYTLEPGRWREAGEGFLTAATALDGWATALETAQAAARQAAAEHTRGDQVSASARSAYEADVASVQARTADAAAQGSYLNVVIEPFHDPGQAIREAAVTIVEGARADLEAAAHTCADAVRAGCAAAPEKRGWLESGLAFVGGVLEGAGEAVWELGKLVSTPFWKPLADLTDLATGHLTPEELAMRNQLTLEQAGALLHALEDDPLAFGEQVGKALLDWDTWADDPARALGHLVPDAVITIATAGAGGAAVAGERGAMGASTLARHADDIADAATDLSHTANRLDDLGDLNHLDDLGDVGRLDDLADALTRFDDVPPAPQGTHLRLDDPNLEPWLDDVVSRHPEMDREGVRGVWDYTTNDGYTRMNGEMRSPGGDVAAEQRIDATNRGLDQLPTYEGTTYRGTNLPQHVVDDVEAGRPLTDPAFSSSSLRQDVAEGFMNKHGDNPTRITIEGRSGVNVQPFSAAQGEAEILFRGGTKFEVLENSLGPDGVRNLLVREVPR